MEDTGAPKGSTGGARGSGPQADFGWLKRTAECWRAGARPQLGTQHRRSRGVARFPLVLRAPDRGPSASPRLRQPKAPLPCGAVPGGMLSPFLPSFPFSLRFVLSAPDAVQQRRLLGARLACSLLGARLWCGLQKCPEPLGLAMGRVTCWRGRSSPQTSRLTEHKSQSSSAPCSGVPAGRGTFVMLCLWPPLRGQC